jgi:cyclophilin family peptidyl-prolyl cis-trans isomerase
MSSSRRKGRRVPPKHGARPFPPPPAAPGSAGTGASGTGASGTGASGTGASGTGAAGTGGGAAGRGPDSSPQSGQGAGGGSAATESVRGLTRSQNRAAKRAATGVQAKRVRGRVSGRKNRGYSPAVLGLAVGAVLAVGAIFIFGNPFGGTGASPSPEGSATPAATRLLTGCPTEAPAPMPAGQKRTVTLTTTKGDIVIDVEADLAPVAAANFVALAECGFYDGVIFHRVIPDFMIQGGDGQYAWIGALDESKAGGGDPGYEFDDDPVVGDYTRGTVAMANSGADTNGSQFFIMVKDSTTLPKDYVIFGHVTSGMEVADQIVGAPRDDRDFPDDPVVMTSVTVAPLPSPSPAVPASPAPSLPAGSGPPASPAPTR